MQVLSSLLFLQKATAFYLSVMFVNRIGSSYEQEQKMTAITGSGS
jgi:hypothetical protein